MIATAAATVAATEHPESNSPRRTDDLDKELSADDDDDEVNVTPEELDNNNVIPIEIAPAPINSSPAEIEIEIEFAADPALVVEPDTIAKSNNHRLCKLVDFGPNESKRKL